MDKFHINYGQISHQLWTNFTSTMDKFHMKLDMFDSVHSMLNLTTKRLNQLNNILKAKDIKQGIVVQHNTLIEACHRMTLTEMRIINVFISKLRRDRVNDIDTEFILSIDAYNDLYGTTNSIRSVSMAVDKLFTRSVLLRCDYTDGSGHRYDKRRIAFVSSAGYSEGHIAISFTREILGLLENLKSNFTPIPLEVISKLQTTYGIRILELLKQYLRIGNRTMPIHDIRVMFDLENKYKVYSDFKKRVIDAAIEDINTHTEYTVSYMAIKKNRRVIAFDFSISKSSLNRLFKFIDIFNKEKESRNKLFVGRHAILSIDEQEDGMWYAKTKVSHNPLDMFKLLESSGWKYTVGYIESGYEQEFKL